jgi:hypothetical protein
MVLLSAIKRGGYLIVKGSVLSCKTEKRSGNNRSKHTGNYIVIDTDKELGDFQVLYLLL